MRLFGLQITKASPANISSVPATRGWWPVWESFSGAWQRNVVVDQQAVLAFHAVFACMTLIASDVAKLRVKLVSQDSDGIWSETANGAYSPVLRKPNGYQTRIQFWENWMLSKLSRGNTYVLKQRDGRRVVTGLYVLDPNRVRPVVTGDGAVYYELTTDNLAGLQEPQVYVPASEIIHDRFNCLFHPLVGLSPLYASGLSATQGLSIQNTSTRLFQNASQPGGLLIAPARIDPDDAKRLKEYWDENFTGKNTGKIAVLGDGMKFESLAVHPVDAQLVEQLKLSAEVVCSTFHVPPYKIGVGALPSYNNVQALQVEYYSQCLQVHIEAAEVLMDEGLGTGEKLGTEFDVDNLMRMDAATQMDVLEKSKGKLTVNEQRGALNRKPVKGGDTVYLQEQDHSLEWLAKRDAEPINPPAAPPAPNANDNQPTPEEQAQQRAMQRAFLEKRIRELVNA